MSWLTRVVPKEVRSALLAAWRAAVAALLASLFGHVAQQERENVRLQNEVDRLSASYLSNPVNAR